MPPIPEADKQAALLLHTRSFYNDLDRLAQSLYSGRITLGMWEEDMRTRLRIHLTGAAMIGKGDHENMTHSDWGRVGAHLKKQYQWLHGFSQAIYDNRETISEEAIRARSHLYADAANTVATDIQAGDLRDQLPYLPGDGSTECLNRCGCAWMIYVAEENRVEGVKTVSATWTLNPPLEHCPTCLSRDGQTEMFELPIDYEVPGFIGLGAF
jgi:hypothetical protein